MLMVSGQHAWQLQHTTTTTTINIMAMHLWLLALSCQ